MAEEDEFHQLDTQIVDVSESLDEDAVSEMLDRTVAGKYKILRRLARGGMGVVYVAEHTSLGRQVVIKVLSYHLADDSRAKSRFEREARGLSVLDHPNVVTVHDFGIEKGLTYIVMEYIDGENLSQRVRRKGRIPYDELLPIAMQTIEAIAAAHQKGIVHRDVKPSNVMVTKRAGRPDFVKVLDFGLAKLATQSVDITKGNLVGTVSYLSPEVIKGAEATPAADVYALGVMLYYLLTGAKPFEASDDMSVLYQHVNVDADWLGSVVPPGEAPDAFLDFIHLCMEKNPDQRPRDAMEMRERLGDLVSLPTISAFSLDSSSALPRYAPPDSSAEAVKRPQRITRPSGERARRGSSIEMSRQSMSRPSISRARPKGGLRIAVIAFTSFSIGLVAFVIFVRMNKPAEPAKVTEPEPTAPAEPTVEPQPETPPVPTTAMFVLETTPPAQVAIDGEIKGRSPIRLELEPGRHVVSASEAGFKTWTQSIELSAGQQRDVEVFLQESGSSSQARVEIEQARPVVAAKPEPRKNQPVAPPPATEVPVATNNATNNATTGSTAAAAAVEEPEQPDEPAVPAFAPDDKKGLLSVDDDKSGLLPVED